MVTINPYETKTESGQHEDRANTNSYAKWLLPPLLGAIGVVSGVLLGFFGGFLIFGDAGDFTMIFVTGCIVAGAAAGGVAGLVGGFAMAKSIR